MGNRACRLSPAVSRGIVLLFIALFTFASLSPGHLAAADDDLLLLIQKKQRELKEREDALARQEERLKALRQDLDERMAKYEKLLEQIETALTKLETRQEEKIDSVVKAYEVMPAEEAADRLAALPEGTAIKILRRMKPKKAGTIMASMDAKKVASLTERMTTVEKNFPVQ